jgi:ferredoxin--NADP+ reductase
MNELNGPHASGYVPELPDVELNLLTPKAPGLATVVENRIVTKESSPHFVRHLTLDITGSGLEGKLRSGQSIGVLAPGEDANGRPHKLRLYSLSSPTAGESGHRHLVSTTVKRTIEEIDGKLYTGVCSNYLCDLKPGDQLRITGPSGKRFILPANPLDWNYLFFATGTGIAPFRGMIQELYESGYNQTCALIFGCAYRTDVLYAEELAATAARHEGFHHLVSVSREGRLPDGTKDYVQSQLVQRRELLEPVLWADNTLIYICGLKGMETGIYRQLLDMDLTGYFELREGWTGDASALDDEQLKKAAKAGPRIFEEVY